MDFPEIGRQASRICGNTYATSISIEMSALRVHTSFGDDDWLSERSSDINGDFTLIFIIVSEDSIK